jgi:hypothetical protein
MKKKVIYIPTLQEYMKKRKKERVDFLEIRNCNDCDYYRDDLNVCLCNDNIKTLSGLKTCPITSRDLKQEDY